MHQSSPTSIANNIIPGAWHTCVALRGAVSGVTGKYQLMREAVWRSRVLCALEGALGSFSAQTRLSTDA